MKLILALALTILAGCATAPPAPPVAQLWEYKTVTGTVSGSDPQQRLDAKITAYTAQGWEFVSAGQAAEHWGFAVLRHAVKATPQVTVGPDRGTNGTTTTASGHTFLLGKTTRNDSTNGLHSVSVEGAPPLFYQWFATNNQNGAVESKKP